jgi:ketosteroid isomerase-like protein
MRNTKLIRLPSSSTNCSGDSAYAITRYESTNGGQKAIGVNLVVLKKTTAGWKIVAHASAVPDPATAIQSLDVQE